MVHWQKEHGQLPEHASEDSGTLTITNVQYDDSGIYVCQAQNELEIVEQKVTVNVECK